jgi:hypothetical protein
MPHEIPVFRAEIEAGLAHVVRTTASVAYEVPLEPLAQDDPLRLAAIARAALGAVPDSHPDDELFYMRDVLVTSCWNLNDDVFDRLEMWAARRTPVDKPLNFRHDQANIIGHIVATQAVAADLTTPLADDLAADDVPSTYHLVNGSVIYRYIGDQARREFIEKTIAEIKAGKWSVSMEALFRGFDYAVRRPDGTQHVVARSEKTAWLTKYLRAYPPPLGTASVDPQLGSGVYVDRKSGDRYELGRLMRNITFCGKGLVEQPGNPASLIFRSAAAFTPNDASPVYVLASGECRENTTVEIQSMPESTAEAAALQTRIDGLTASLEAALAEVTSLKSKGLEARVASLETQLAIKTEEALNQTARAVSAEATVSDLTGRLTASETALNTAHAELAVITAERSRDYREKLLVDKKAPSAVKASLIESFKGLADEAFASTVEALAPAWLIISAPVDSTAALNRAVVDADVALAATTPVTGTPSQVVTDYFANHFLRTPALAEAREKASR